MLFRLVLVIPAAIAVRIVGLGIYVVLFFMWFVVLITGWLPKPVHEVAQAFIRYEIRLLGYFNLLVPTYPGELFGDLALPAPILLPGGDKIGTYVDAPTAAPPPPPPASQPWKLILSMGAKRLLLVTIVLGIAAAIGLSVFETAAGNHENLVQVNNQLVSDLDQFSTTAKSCQDVSCLEQANGVLSQQLGDFVSAIEGANSAGVSPSLINQLTTAAEHAEQVTGDLADSGPSVARLPQRGLTRSGGTGHQRPRQRPACLRHRAERAAVRLAAVLVGEEGRELQLERSHRCLSGDMHLGALVDVDRRSRAGDEREDGITPPLLAQSLAQRGALAGRQVPSRRLGDQLACQHPVQRVEVLGDEHARRIVPDHRASDDGAHGQRSASAHGQPAPIVRRCRRHVGGRPEAGPG